MLPRRGELGGFLRLPGDVRFRAVRVNRLGWFEDGVKRGNRCFG